MEHQAPPDERAHHWHVGIDMSQRSHGAIDFAHWLRKRSTRLEELRGVYVGANAAIPTQGPEASAQFSNSEVVPSDTPERELCRLVRRDDAYGLIVGRTAPIEGWSLLSLGRVTRRLLRSLPCPVVVVPPDLDVDQLGKGPIIVGVQPDPTSVPAVRFARELGARLSLEVLLVHTVEPAPGGTPFASSDLLDLDERTRAARRALKGWVERHGLSDLPRRIEIGVGGVGLVRAADRANATLLVSGSRHLSLGSRIFQSSMGSELAAHARCPVAVVPSEPQGPAGG